MNPPPLFRKSQLRVLRSSLTNGTTSKGSNDGSRVWRISGPTYAARSLPQYISAFATRVLLSTYVCGKGERAWARIFTLLRHQFHGIVRLVSETLYVLYTLPLCLQNCRLSKKQGSPKWRFLCLFKVWKFGLWRTTSAIDVSVTSHFHWLLVV